MCLTEFPRSVWKRLKAVGTYYFSRNRENRIKLKRGRQRRKESERDGNEQESTRGEQKGAILSPSLYTYR